MQVDELDNVIALKAELQPRCLRSSFRVVYLQEYKHVLPMQISIGPVERNSESGLFLSTCRAHFMA
jgi:hypothetical protein